jgi:alpha-1,4-N-acetylglucosaminyltransferase EXTL3
MPFKIFPSTPFEPFLTTDVKYTLQSNVTVGSIDQNFYIGGSNTGHYFLERGLGGNHDDEQFTIIMLTYKREKILMLLIDKYLKLAYLNKIIVVWNSLDVKPTDGFLWKYKRFIDIRKLCVIQSRENSLNNRFIPYGQIETDAILNLDDDTPLRNDEIAFAFRAWRENRHRLVGFPARYHTWNITEQKYRYGSYRSCEYSLILTGAVFYHRFYHYMYSYVMDYRIRHMVDRYRNCEDLAFNYMVSAFTRQAPIKVTARTRFYCDLCDRLKETSASSSNPLHYSLRTDCINELNLIYGYNPLVYSQTRMDSVLYKTRLEPEYKKCFRHV